MKIILQTDDEGEQSYEKSKWTKNPTVIADETRRECDPEQPSTDSRTAKTPLDYFKLFFDMELLSTIVEQSKKYALQKNTSLDLSTDELHVFLGILLFSGYGKYPNRRIYWSNEDDVPKIVQDSMRLKGFEKISKHIHFSDNATLVQEDRLYKIRPLIDKLAKNFRQHGGLQEHLSIDESMVPYYGKHYAKQYIRGKPIRFGFKNWALCTNEGYMVGFDIYIGKNSSLEKHFGVGGDIVLALLQQTEVPKNEGYKIYFDNYFTSLPLLAHLSVQKYCATGTNPFTDVRNHLNTDDLWLKDRTAPDYFAVVMSKKRSHVLLQALQFNDMETRAQKHEVYNLATSIIKR
ncbi:transposase is4 [Holotrichia oblita]|uniref:Transposase is4 n=1 Tax=Holotrichia oblita TaxID=644536 RepID=A0ACB9TAS6_HOLOL|nr:transposase is4 [Holotrichia oblita]